MYNHQREIPRLLAVLIALATLAGLAAAYKRLHVEQRNRRVEIAVEWAEVYQLAQASHTPPESILKDFKTQSVSTLVLQEDTLATLEQAGAIHPNRLMAVSGRSGTRVDVDSVFTLNRLRAALAARRVPFAPLPTGEAWYANGGTLFTVATGTGAPSVPAANPGSSEPSASEPNTPTPAATAFAYSPTDYSTLRTLGIGLPPEGVTIAQEAGLRIAGRINNFPGVNTASARAVLQNLVKADASTVIFSGDEVLGFRGLEKEVAVLLRDPNAPATSATPTSPLLRPTGLLYGAVEFGKQKGDEKLVAALHGDYVRVHSIQSAEMGQMDKEEAVERFVRAARERNIRFCYVRLLTFSGPNPVHENVAFLNEIARGMAHGSALRGGDLKFGAARRFQETGIPALLFPVIALGTAAGTVWMLRLLYPLRGRMDLVLLVVLAALFAGMAWGLDETGRKLIALLAGIVFPTIACLKTFPQASAGADPIPGLTLAKAKETCILQALRALALASAITALGIVQVVGLLATRPFMLLANQFLGIKAQHAVPVLIIAVVAIIGGAFAPGETTSRYRARIATGMRAAYNEPARFGVLLLVLIGLAGMVLVVARTGNDSGVGVSGFELKARAILDTLLPVRPRTKEFLVGHPAFVLALAWWWRGRRKLAIPAFVVGSLGQVSLLNTFCHIHTPLIVSIWRDALGLFFGALIGIALFYGIEACLKPPGEMSKER